MHIITSTSHASSRSSGLHCSFRFGPVLFISLPWLLALVLACTDDVPNGVASTVDMRDSPSDLGMPLDTDVLSPDHGTGPVLERDGGVKLNDFGLDSAASKPDAFTPPTAPGLALSLAAAEIIGSHSWLQDGGLLLDRQSVIRWRVDPQTLGQWRWSVRVKAKVWRYEDGQLSIGFDGVLLSGHLHGDGRGRSSWVRMPYDAWDSYQPQISLPDILHWSGDELRETFSMRAETGGLIVYGVALGDARSPIENEAPIPDVAEQQMDFSACDEPECDDGARLSQIIANADDSPLRIRLISSSYTARTSVVIRRSNVQVVGPVETEAPLWRWQPMAGSGQRSSFEFRGAGVGGADQMPTVESVTSGQRRFLVSGAVPPDLKWVRLTADDFGDIPPVCLGGRDVERFHRHQRQLFRVLETQVQPTGVLMVLDRAVHLDIPLSANPRFTPTQLLVGVEIRNIALLAECPEALGVALRDPVCTNPEVVDDGGVLSLFTDGVLIERVNAQGFGKFTIEIRDSLANRVSNCGMDHPAAYGGGGQGYGVHLIGASRTVVHGQSVSVARHGVVVDFGSSDSQILDSTFSNMNQALIDVHGEASRDTLIRGNNLSQSNLGIIVGGGGRAVHCNDEPRHHILGNTISDCSIAAVSVSDYTRTVYVRSNELARNSTHVLGTFGAHDIQVERNHFREAGITPVTLALEDSRDLRVRRNVFVDVCDQADAFLALGGAEVPTFQGNWFCPDE
jgi:hypothetical protein